MKVYLIRYITHTRYHIRVIHCTYIHIYLSHTHTHIYIYTYMNDPQTCPYCRCFHMPLWGIFYRRIHDSGPVIPRMNIQLCEILRDGAGRGSDGMGLGAQLRKIRIQRLQVPILMKVFFGRSFLVGPSVGGTYVGFDVFNLYMICCYFVFLASCLDFLSHRFLFS